VPFHSVVPSVIIGYFKDVLKITMMFYVRFKSDDTVFQGGFNGASRALQGTKLFQLFDGVFMGI